MTMSNEPKENKIGDQTKRYLSQLINDLKGKEPKEPLVPTSPVTPKEPKPSTQPVLFGGSLLPTQSSDNQNADDQASGPGGKGKIKLTDKEQALLKAFRKLN